MKRAAIPSLILILSLCLNTATVNNDDSCDNSVLPAATLLLPYFAVDLGSESFMSNAEEFAVKTSPASTFKIAHARVSV